MPCRSEPLDLRHENCSCPSCTARVILGMRGTHIHQAAKLLVYVQRKLGRKPHDWLVRQSLLLDADDERCVTSLCAELKKLSPKQVDAIVYNARDKTSRDLADWWEEHQKADAKREAEEKTEQARNNIKRRALAKLSKAEKEVLGLKE